MRQEEPNASSEAESTTIDLAAPMLVEPGTIVNGRYLVREGILGRGGFGTVYLAHDRTLDRDVALKLLSPRRAAAMIDPGYGKFLAEARTIARLDHPNIVPVYDAGIHEGRPWIAMRIVRGESLATILARDKRLDPARAIGLLEMIARALGHAHRRGVVHRDVKPANVVIERSESGDEHPWLLDFGVARVIAGESTWGERAVAGTPSYMAPEQILGKPVDGKADLFSLACVAVEMLSGDRPFTGSDISEIASRIVLGEPAGLADVARHAGAAAAAALTRALSKSSQDRFADADAMASALAHSVTRGERAKPIGSPSLAARFGLARTAMPAWDGRSTLVISGLVKGYTFRGAVLNNLQLEVPRGAAYALLGRNGTGKTTLIRTFLGMYRPDGGSIRVFGRNPWTDRIAVASRVGHVPPQLAAYEGLRVGEFLRFVSRFRNGWDASYARHLTARFELPQDVRIRTLSHGMRTKVSLLAALSHRPEFLVLDDPTVGLDAVVLDEFFDTLLEISRKEGTTLLIASHNVDEVERFATHAGFLSDGRMLVSEPLPELLSKKRRIRARFRDGVPDSVATLGLVDSRSDGQELTAVTSNDAERTETLLRAMGAEEIRSEPVSLRELFVAMMR
jgi:ABC-type multidrug transport system ATPase subunit